MLAHVIVFFMIVYLSFPDGEAFPANPEDRGRLREGLGQLVTAHEAKIVVKDPGDYDITPEIWTTNTHDHQLTVLENGKGIYMLEPKDAKVAILNSDRPAILERGGKAEPIDEKSPVHIISGGHPRKFSLQIFGILFYLDPSKQKSA